MDAPYSFPRRRRRRRSHFELVVVPMRAKQQIQNAHSCWLAAAPAQTWPGLPESTAPARRLARPSACPPVCLTVRRLLAFDAYVSREHYWIAAEMNRPGLAVVSHVPARRLRFHLRTLGICIRAHSLTHIGFARAKCSHIRSLALACSLDAQAHAAAEQTQSHPRMSPCKLVFANSLNRENPSDSNLFRSLNSP